MAAPPSPYALNKTHPIPARSGVAVPVLKGQTIRVINTHGTQVVDFWCFAASHFPPTGASANSSTSTSATTTTTPPPLAHYLSLPHTRASTCRLTPLVNDVLTSNQRAPILTLLRDTSPGVHDTLIAACDIFRYRELAHQPVATAPRYYHENCADNCRDALLALAGSKGEEGKGWAGLEKGRDWTPPAPLNLWMNIPVHPKGAGEGARAAGPSCGANLSFERPVSKEGDEVVFRAEMDVVCVMSACPQDLLEINCGRPVECEFEVREK